jgi:hypothetical protein
MSTPQCYVTTLLPLVTFRNTNENPPPTHSLASWCNLWTAPKPFLLRGHADTFIYFPYLGLLPIKSNIFTTKVSYFFVKIHIRRSLWFLSINKLTWRAALFFYKFPQQILATISFHCTCTLISFLSLGMLFSIKMLFKSGNDLEASYNKVACWNTSMQAVLGWDSPSSTFKVFASSAQVSIGKVLVKE